MSHPGRPVAEPLAPAEQAGVGGKLVVAIPVSAGECGSSKNMRWRIELLGGIRAVEVGGTDKAITRFRTLKAALLLAYLALYRNRQHPRETLIELLWPEADEPDARRSLSVALSSLRDQMER